METWVDNTIWWHVYPLAFLGGEKTALPEGAPHISRLKNLEPWLRYMMELGCNGLLLCPIFASGSHGYDTIDHFTVDARLGSNDDFQWLVETCRSLGIKVVLDGVFNHVGRRFGPFEDVRARRQNSQYASWFHIDWNNTHNEDGFGYQNFEGHSQLVTLNHDNADVVQYVANVAKHWLRLGINGWRLDAAYTIPQHFWRSVIPQVHMEFPDAWFLAEVIHGDYANIVKQTGINSITQYELWKAIWSSLNDRNFFELSHALNRHNQFLTTFTPNIFLGNHDVTRIATQLKEVKHLDLAMALLFTLPGIPSVYSGDEQAFSGRKEHRPGGDDQIRPAFPGDPSGLAPDGWSVFTKYQTMIRFRKNNAWLTRAKINVQTLKNTFLAYEVVKDGQKIVVALNCGDTSERMDAHNLPAKTIELAGVDSQSDERSVDAHSARVWHNG